MFSVNTNMFSARSMDTLRTNQQKVAQGFERLSSGLRINGAKDDAAGLSISTRMTAQIRGVNQSVRNANDTISFLQTAEGALNETTNILQRMRELTVQAGNNILSASDRQSIQGEMEQLKSEIDRINQTTNFNGQSIFSQHKTVSVAQTAGNGGKLRGYTVNYDTTLGAGPADKAERLAFALNGLQTSWLREAEDRVETYYGLSGNGSVINVDFTDAGDAAGGTAAFVSIAGGVTTPQRLHIDLNDFDDTNAPNGGTPNQYSDRIIAHEFVHAAMNANGVRQNVETWFNEGAAELIHGSADVFVLGAASITAMVADAFNASPINYGGSYLAVAKIHADIQDNGGEGISDLFDELKTNGNDLSAAMQSTAGYSLAGFKSSFVASSGPGNGVDFAHNLFSRAQSSGDTGAIGGFALDNGSIFTAESILPNTVYSNEEKSGGVQRTMQIGAGSQDSDLKVSVSSFNTDAMGIAGLDVVNFLNVDDALLGLDDALNFVSARRSELGALQSRVESMISSLQINMENTSASRSRIQDADFASESVNLTKAQITQQASASMLAQANTAPRLALALLG